MLEIVKQTSTYPYPNSVSFDILERGTDYPGTPRILYMNKAMKMKLVGYALEPRFNEVPRDWANWFVILSVRYIENLVVTNLLESNQSVRYIGV